MTTYTTQSHKYIDCADPENCTKAAHWYGESGERYGSQAEALAAVELDDAPAINIIEIRRAVVGRRG